MKVGHYNKNLTARFVDRSVILFTLSTEVSVRSYIQCIFLDEIIKLCDPCLSAFEALCVKMRYTYRRILYLLYFVTRLVLGRSFFRRVARISFFGFSMLVDFYRATHRLCDAYAIVRRTHHMCYSSVFLRLSVRLLQASFYRNR